MTKIIAIFNQSGGVAKTTLTQNLGYHLGTKKKRVLLIDMDPQASLTNFMGVDPDTLEKTIYDTIINEEPVYVYPEKIHGVSLAPTNINLSATELELASAIMREMRLKNALEPILEDYDYILIDCPPSLGLLSIISLVAATHVLVPIQCQFKSFQGTDLLLDTFAKIRKAANRNLKIAGFIPTMYDGRTAQESRTFKAISEQLSQVSTVYEPIPKTIAFPDASEARLPLALFSNKHPAIDALKKITLSLEKLK